MAHFAELTDNNTVVTVIVIANDEILNNEGIEDEQLGIAFCKSLYGDTTKWKQTSYNATFRKHYAGVSYVYDEVRDAFIGPKPFSSSVLDEDTCSWNAPIAYPDASKRYEWDEGLYQSDNTKGWVLDAPLNQYP